MKYEEWIEQTKKVLHQYDEGAIFASEAFNAIVGRAYEVEIPQTELEQQAELNASNLEYLSNDEYLLEQVKKKKKLLKDIFGE